MPDKPWPAVQTNRHKHNKVRNCSDEHLAGRWQQLRADLLDVTRVHDLDRHRLTTRAIHREMIIIENEIKLRRKQRA